MPKFVIERNMPELGNLSDAEFKDAARHSSSVLQAMGAEVQWIESYVTRDKMFCVYLSPSEALIREHAERSGFPAHTIRKVERIISPMTAEA